MCQETELIQLPDLILVACWSKFGVGFSLELTGSVGFFYLLGLNFLGIFDWLCSNFVGFLSVCALYRGLHGGLFIACLKLIAALLAALA